MSYNENPFSELVKGTIENICCTIGLLGGKIVFLTLELLFNNEKVFKHIHKHKYTNIHKY